MLEYHCITVCMLEKLGKEIEETEDSFEINHLPVSQSIEMKNKQTFVGMKKDLLMVV